jgi:site-specific DNA-methyltransferase (cytosine-N4-specific)
VPYGQFSYLPLQWIDLADIEPGIDAESWLRTTQEIDRRSLGGKNGGELEPQIAHLSQRSEAYRNVILLLEDQLPDRKARVTRFFFDFDGSIVKIVPALRPNAYLIWIVGNRHVGGQEIPADQILVDILSHHRVSLVTRTTRKIAFRRMAARNTLTTMMRQEHILVFRKTGE